MKKSLWIVIASMMVLTLVTSIYFRTRSENKPVELITTRLHYAPIARSVTATGTIQPVDTVEVGSQVSGTIKNIYADYNSVVRAGQLIAELDKSLLTAQASQYLANLQSAESQVVYQKQNLDRQTQLYNEKVIAKADLETAQDQYKMAAAAVESVKAQLSAAEKNLSYTNIYSPINGVVLSRNINVGQTVAASFNTPVFFSIAKDLSKMQVRAAVDEADVGDVASGQEVSFTVDAFPDEVFSGTVKEVRLQPVVTANVVTYVTIIDAPNKDMKLKPGMTSNITIFIKQEKNAALIPVTAIDFHPGPLLAKQYRFGEDSIYSSKNVASPNLNDSSYRGAKPEVVWVLNDHAIIKKTILTGLNDNLNIQVLAGLDENDVVIVGMGQDKNPKEKPEIASSPFMPARRPAGIGNNGIKPQATNPAR